MMKKLFLLGSFVALFVSQYALAVCLGNIEMHDNSITNVSVTGVAGTSEAVNKHYVDEYIKRHDQDRLNGTQLSVETDTKKWIDAQDYCAKLVSKAIIPENGSDADADQIYKDWHLPTRVEYLSACLANGSNLDYDQQSWTAAGQCQVDNDYFWLNTYHTGQIVGRVSGEIDYMFKYDTIQSGKAELFQPTTGDSIRDHGDKEYQVRCIR